VLIVSTSKGYNLVVKKSEAGTWEFLDEHASPKQAGVARYANTTLWPG
jgi:hypothetical protein